LNLPGIHLEQETVRYYPKLDLAAHLLGFVSADAQALGGIEYAYDSVIRGEPGKILVQLDGGRHWMQTTINQPSTPAGRSSSRSISTCSTSSSANWRRASR